MRRLLFLLAVSAVLSACPSPEMAPDAGVTGGGGGEVTGGGAGGGGGTERDAGAADAGPRFDAGQPDDAGVDAGLDAGPVEPVDAGTPGESCALPRDVVPTDSFDGGYEAIFRVEPIADSLTTSCAADAGREAVYRFEVTNNQTISVVLSGPPGGAQVNVSVREGDCTTGHEWACVPRTATSTNTSQALRLPGRTAGTYFLVVELESGPWVDVDLRVDTPFAPPSNDQCADAEALTFVGGVAAVSGWTFNAMNDTPAGSLVPTCDPGNATEDVVFSYTLTQPQDVHIRMQSTSSGNGFAQFYVRRDCSSLSVVDELACGWAPVAILNQQPGTYYVWVDGPMSLFNLRVELAPPTPTPSNDQCTMPTRLFADGGTHDLQNGTTRGASTSLLIDCQYEANTPDVFYSLSVAVPQRLEAIARPTLWDGGLLQPTLGLYSASMCTQDGGVILDAGATIRGCATGVDRAPGTLLTASELAPGDYLLAVQGYQSRGPFELEARLLPVAVPPSNDTCATVQQLTLDGNGHAELRGTTRGAADDHIGSVCRPVAGTPDVVYSFTTPSVARTDAGFDALVNVRSENSTEYRPSLYVNLFCEPAFSSQNACASRTFDRPSRAAALAKGLTPATTYYVFVDSAHAGRPAGPFSMSLDVKDEATNERCESARALPLNSTLTGTLLGARSDYDATFYGASCVNPVGFGGMGGPDVVYSFVAPASGTYVVNLDAAPGFDLYVLVMDGACDGTGTCAALSAQSSVLTHQASFSAVAGRTYHFIVDSEDAYAGGNSQSAGGISSFGISVSQ